LVSIKKLPAQRYAEKTNPASFLRNCFSIYTVSILYAPVRTTTKGHFLPIYKKSTQKIWWIPQKALPLYPKCKINTKRNQIQTKTFKNFFVT